MRVIIHRALIGRVLKTLERKAKQQQERDGVSSGGLRLAAFPHSPRFIYFFFLLFRI